MKNGEFLGDLESHFVVGEMQKNDQQLCAKNTNDNLDLADNQLESTTRGLKQNNQGPKKKKKKARSAIA